MVLNGIPISDEECIGDSLATINSAFQTLSANVESLNATPTNISAFNVFDSPTIDLNWNASTRTLSAVTTASVATSSSQMVAKAWVNFDGTLVTNPGSTTGIRSSYNISSITDVGIGEYQVNMSVSQLNSNFAVFCESGITAGVGALNPTRPDVWLAPMTSWGNSYVTVNINNNQGPNDDSSLVTVVIFSN